MLQNNLIGGMLEMAIKNLNKFMGKPIEGSLEKVLVGLEKESDKENERGPQSEQDKKGYIYVPSEGIYIAKKRAHLGLDWYQTHEVLHKERLRMPTIPEFISFLNYLRADYQSINRKEANQILDDILKLGEWRGNWLDADFKVIKGKIHINYNHQTVNGKLTPKDSEPLESCLMEDGWADIFNPNRQGLPTKQLGDSYQQGKNSYYWKPLSDNNSVAGFFVDSGGADLGCNWDPSSSGSALGVFTCAEGTTQKK